MTKLGVAVEDDSLEQDSSRFSPRMRRSNPLLEVPPSSASKAAAASVPVEAMLQPAPYFGNASPRWVRLPPLAPDTFKKPADNTAPQQPFLADFAHLDDPVERAAAVGAL